jgi:hypothetical protein
MKKYIFLLILLASLSSVKCKKTDAEDQLPPITTSGANTFGCLVDGKVWVPHGDFSVSGLSFDYFIDLIDKKPYLHILANNRKTNKSVICFNLENITDTGSYNKVKFKNSYIFYDDGSKSFYMNDSSNSIRLTKFDTTAKIISGEFSFFCSPDTSAHLNKIVHITEGRFDCKYPTTIH